MSLTNQVGNTLSQEEKINKLIKYFSEKLAENIENEFEKDILNQLSELKEKYQDRSIRRYVGIHMDCGGMLIKQYQCTWCENCGKYFCGCNIG